jgi:hypothetical protein
MMLAKLLLGILYSLSLNTPSGQSQDDAATRVGRMSALSGAVQYRSPAGEWAAALVNEPIATGVGVRSGRGATAEWRVAASRVTLDGATELTLVRLDREVFEVALTQGRIGIHLGTAGAAKTVEIDLPSGGVWLDAPGDYDIAAGDERTPARIVVFAGKARFGGGLGETAIAAASPDAFDVAWRGRGDGDDAPARLPAAMTGAESLAANGDWETDATFGAVWYPKGVAADWTPYRYGRWRNLAPWGWTWIDDADWGFAPSHYGRWARIGGRWAWAPGPRGDDPPLYSPAAVAFLGTAGIGLSRPGAEGAAVAWFPLGPGETVSADADAQYRNRRSATIVPRAVFAAGRPVQLALLELPEQRLDNAPVVVGALDISPVAAKGTALAAELPGSAPVKLVRAAPAAPEKLAIHVAQERSRELFLTRIHAALAHALHKKLRPATASSAHHWRAASVEPTRPRVPPSTAPTHSAHNRSHLAATRGGAN